RRFAICCIADLQSAGDSPITNRRYSRLQICGTSLIPAFTTTMKTRTGKTARFTMMNCNLIALCTILLAEPGAWALPKIKVLATGGTIAGAQKTQADAGYKSGAFSV